jgi:hypothetical protein
MNSTIASVSAVVIQDSFYWSAHAVINGSLTTASCMHNHKREDLAEKCLGKVEKRWEVIAGSTHTIKEVENLLYPIYEVRWMEQRPNGTEREVWQRFCIYARSI